MKILSLVLSLAMLVGNADVTKQAHATTHVVMIGEAKCSSTAVGPHALLTATHCEDLLVNRLLVDGKRAYITDTIRDKHDHSILLLDGITFADTATFSKTALEVADDFFMFGNPGTEFDVYRRGYVAGKRPSDDSLLLDVNGFPGDSGAAMFNTSGQITDIISFGFTNTQDDSPWSQTFMGAYPLKFTADQISRAVGYVPTVNLFNFERLRPGVVLGLFPELRTPLSPRPSVPQKP